MDKMKNLIYLIIEKYQTRTCFTIVSHIIYTVFIYSYTANILSKHYAIRYKLILEKVAIYVIH